MKKMFLFVVVIFTLGLFMVSCEKEPAVSDDVLIEEIAFATDRQVVEPTQLPATATNYIEEIHFDTYVEEVYFVEGKGYEVRFGSDEVCYFNGNGETLMFRGRNSGGRFGARGPHGPCHRMGHRFGAPVALEDLPQEITDYVAENYPDNEIKRAKLNNNGEYIVLVNVPIILKFDGEGTFIDELTPLQNCHRRCQRIAIEDLPAAVTDYIGTNYAEATFKRACTRPGGRYVVFLVGDEGRIILIFDADGNFLTVR